jgi:hypothetical protein
VVFLAIKKGHSLEHHRANTLESLKQKLTVGEYEIFELVYTDTVEYSHKVVEVRPQTNNKRELPL